MDCCVNCELTPRCEVHAFTRRGDYIQCPRRADFTVRAEGVLDIRVCCVHGGEFRRMFRVAVQWLTPLELPPAGDGPLKRE